MENQSKHDKPKQREQRREQTGEWFKNFQHFVQEQPFRGVLQSIDDFFKQPLFIPPFSVEVRDLADRHLIIAELPGIKKEQIEINIIGSSLTIGINHQDILVEEDEINRIIRRSESLQHSSRTVHLPHPINETEVTANYQNGLLNISIPKTKGKKIELMD